MKIVIDIPELLYKTCKKWQKNKVATVEQSLIANGIPYEERSKGEWIINEEWSLLEKCKVTIYTCPFCGKVEHEPFDYCRCGADMRKENEDENSN